MTTGDSVWKCDSQSRMNYLMDRTGTVRELVACIPSEIGSFHIREKKTRQGISFLDWKINFRENIHVKKKGMKEMDEVQFIFFLNRNLEWNAGDHSILMEPGEACIYRDCSQTTTADYSGGCDFLFKSLQLPASVFMRIIRDYFNEQEQKTIREILKDLTKMTITPDMYRLLREIQDSDRYQGGVGALYLESKILELLSACLQSRMGQDSMVQPSGCVISRTDKEAILSVKQRIDLLGIVPEGQGTQKALPDALWSGIQIPGCEQMAREANLSVTKLTRGFTQLVGVSLHAYVIERRLEYAAGLLSENSFNVSQAAALAGYSNMSHFSAAFKKRYGLTPKEYFKSEKC